jgi:hypothetical protein
VSIIGRHAPTARRTKSVADAAARTLDEREEMQREAGRLGLLRHVAPALGVKFVGRGAPELLAAVHVLQGGERRGQEQDVRGQRTRGSAPGWG